MIIQHNVSNMTAARNNEINSIKMGKSLEKLSSGNKINRSGDDAAGLAVSEKMRAQICGMKQSVKNCQDGVSLIQTFEGALGETVTIIKRMRDLAVQSANGIYDEDIDRSALEIEFRMLCDEVDQLADTDFNGIVMLNGGRMADGFTVLRNADNLVSSESDQLRVPDDISFDSYFANFNDDNTKMTIEFMPNVAGMPIDREMYLALKDMDMSDIQVSLKGGVPEFAMNRDYPNISIRTDPADIYSGILSVNKENGETFDVAKVNLPIYHNAFVHAYGAQITNHIVKHEAVNGNSYDYCSIDIHIRAVTDHAKAFDMAANSCITDNKGINFKALGDGKLLDPRTGSTVTYQDIDNEFAIYPEDPDGIINGSLFNVSAKIDFVSTLNGQNISISDPGHTLARYAYVSGNAHSVSLTYDGNHWIDDATSSALTQLDSFTASLTTPPNNGDKLNLKTTITRIQDFNGKYVDSSKRNTGFDLLEPDVDFSKAENGSVYYYNGNDWTVFGTDRVVKLEDVGVNYPPEKASKWFEGLKISVFNNTNYSDGEISASPDLFNESNYSVPNAFHVLYEGLTFTDHLVLQTNARSKDAVDFTFQYSAMGIGGLPANLNCSASGLGLDKLSAATQKEANEAIDQCSYALNKVLMIRSTFGAAQNRLETKMTTLNNTVINLTDAESRIRNINVADEMMVFSKNRIISEASQAMLAQAKDIPQQVMELLGNN